MLTDLIMSCHDGLLDGSCSITTEEEREARDLGLHWEGSCELAML